jgi:flagellar basal-body rod protein FlgF
MDNSIYITLSRQLALFRDMEATANNIANANTTGFNSEHILFDSFLAKDINQGNRNDMAFAHDVTSYRNTSTGPMSITGNDLDVAIQGDGYFQVETPLGTRYTRAGNFRIGGDGTLITADGYPVLDASGQQIVFPDTIGEIQIGEAGNLKADGEDFATLSIVSFENPQLLERAGNTLYKSEVVPQQAIGARVLQGTLEGANVQPVLELTHMIDVSRSVENTSQFISAMYDLERKASNAWAKPAQ